MNGLERKEYLSDKQNVANFFEKVKTSKSISSEKVSAKSPNRRGKIDTEYEGNVFSSHVAPHYTPLLGPFGMLFNFHLL